MTDLDILIRLPYRLAPARQAQLELDLGLPGQYRGPVRSLNENAGYILIAAALGPLWTALADVWGKDAARALGRWIQGLRDGDAPTSPPRRIELTATARSGAVFVLEEGVDEEALAAMFDVDAAAFTPGVRLRWDETHRAWLPPPAS